MDFTLPELGEQIEAGDVLRVLVKVGDTLVKEQPVLELETDKATIEVPSSVAGTVKEIKVKAGEKVKVGQAILSYDEAPTSAQGDAKPAAPTAGSGNAGAASTAGGGRKAQAVQREGGAPKQASGKSAPAKAADARGGPKEKVDDNEEGQPDVQIEDQSTEPDKAGVKDP